MITASSLKCIGIMHLCMQLKYCIAIQTTFFLLATFSSLPNSHILKEDKVVWLARLALALISSFSENFWVGQILFGWDKNFLKTFVLGQKFSKIFCPRTIIFIPWDKNFLKIFILGYFFSRTKISVTDQHQT